VFDFGEHDGNSYIVMELLDGEALDKRLARSGALPVPNALRITRQVATSLDAAHARGIVHRDLKPENIFLVRDSEVAGGERAKILDFGIAKLGAAEGGLKTQTSALMGTPTYMSPEQCRGAGLVDRRSDIYSLGCVLYNLLVGKPPFESDGVGELIVMHLRETPPSASSRAAGVPPQVDAIIARCLEKDPAQRFQSGRELATAIGALLPMTTGETTVPLTPTPPLPARQPAALPAQATRPETTLSSMAVEADALPRSGRGRMAIVVAGAAVVAGGAALFLLRAGPHGTPAAAVPAPAALSAGPAPAPAAAAPPAAVVAPPPAAPAPPAEPAPRAPAPAPAPAVAAPEAPTPAPAANATAPQRASSKRGAAKKSSTHPHKPAARGDDDIPDSR